MNGAVLLGLMVPFVGTALGAMMVVFVKSEMNHNMQRAFTPLMRLLTLRLQKRQSSLE